MGLGQNIGQSECLWLSHVGRDCSYHQQHIDNDTDHNANDIPHSGTVRETTSTLMITIQPRRVNLKEREREQSD